MVRRPHLRVLCSHALQQVKPFSQEGLHLVLGGFGLVLYTPRETPQDTLRLVNGRTGVAGRTREFVVHALRGGHRRVTRRQGFLHALPHAKPHLGVLSLAPLKALGHDNSDRDVCFFQRGAEPQHLGVTRTESAGNFVVYAHVQSEGYLARNGESGSFST